MARINRFEVQDAYCGYLAQRLTGKLGIRINHDLGNFNPRDEEPSSGSGKPVSTDPINTVAADTVIGCMAANPA